MEVRSAVCWEALVFNGLYNQGIIIIIIIIIIITFPCAMSLFML